MEKFYGQSFITRKGNDLPMGGNKGGSKMKEDEEEEEEDESEEEDFETLKAENQRMKEELEASKDKAKEIAETYERTIDLLKRSWKHTRER